MSRRPTVVAHRGASAQAQENTVEAFRLAGVLGADAIELDARRTADGAVIVHHDAHLADGRAIVELAAAELPAYLPSLTDALDACGDLVVNIEIKNVPQDPDHDESEAVAAEVVAEVARREWQDRVLVSSFSMATIDRVRELDATIPTAFLVYWHDDKAKLVESTIRHGHRILHPWDGLVDAELMSAAHGAGLVVNVWTVDDPDRMRQLIELGVDGIVTNEPDTARKVVDGSA
jgi:glycerophosphoryl diester phosphodiesterase